MRYFLFLFLLLPFACQDSKPPIDETAPDQSANGCTSTVIIKSIDKLPFKVVRIGSTWCLEVNNERLIPCSSWSWDPQLQVLNTKVLLSGDYPEWMPSPNVRYFGRPFNVTHMEKE